MDTLEKGLSILRKAEAALRGVASEAAAAGDYTATMRLVAWGQELSRLSGSPESGAAPRRPPLTTPSTAGAGESGGSKAGAEPSDRGGRGATSGQRSKTRRRDEDYPRFFRRGDLLVKIGWSKREKAEYQHKAPRHVLDAVVEVLRTAGHNEEPIAIPELLPLKTTSGEELPPYQAYLCLAWLRKLGLIQQHGREGYTVGQPATLPGDASSAWDAVERLRAS